MALTQQQLAELAVWAEAYTAQTEQLSAQSSAAVLASYSAPAAWTAAGSAAAAEQAADVSAAAMSTAAGMTAEYVAQSVTTMTGAPAPIPAAFPMPEIRAGKPLTEVYERVYRAFVRRVNAGMDKQRALEISMRYAIDLNDANVRFVEQHAARDVLTYLAPRIGITGYRRVIHPELSRTGTCGLCIAASENIYKTSDLLPMHDRCKCAVLPIIGDEDPGGSLNNLSLQALYADAKDRPDAKRPNSPSAHGFDLKKVRYKVVEHTEYGPTLVNEDHAFTPMGEAQRVDDPDAKQRRTGSQRGAKGRRQAPVTAPTQDEVTAAQQAALAKYQELIGRIDNAVRANSDSSPQRDAGAQPPRPPAPPAAPGGPGGPDGPDGDDSLGSLAPIASGVRELERFSATTVGSARSGRPNPPSPADLAASGASIAPSNGTDAELDQWYETDAERTTAQLLRDRYGLRLRSVKRRLATDGNHPSTPDAMNLAGTWTADFKSVSGYGGMYGALGRSMKQSDRLILDGAGTGLSRVSAENALRDGLARWGEHYAEILVLLPDGVALHWSRDD